MLHVPSAEVSSFQENSERPWLLVWLVMSFLTNYSAPASQKQVKSHYLLMKDMLVV